MSVLAVIKSIGTGVEKAAVESVHVVEVIGNGVVSLEKILTDANKMTPAVKAGLATLVADGEALATAFVGIGSNPANLLADVAGVATVEKFVKDFIAFLPTLKTDAAALFADTKV